MASITQLLGWLTLVFVFISVTVHAYKVDKFSFLMPHVNPTAVSAFHSFRHCSMFGRQGVSGNRSTRPVAYIIGFSLRRFVIYLH